MEDGVHGGSDGELAVDGYFRGDALDLETGRRVDVALVEEVSGGVDLVGAEGSEVGWGPVFGSTVTVTVEDVDTENLLCGGGEGEDGGEGNELLGQHFEGE